MSGELLLLLLTPLRQALERIERKAQPLLMDPALLDREEGQHLLDVSRAGAADLPAGPTRRSGCHSRP